MFVGGPPTVGPGMIVNSSKNETIRSHTDLQKNNAPLFKVRAGGALTLRLSWEGSRRGESGEMGGVRGSGPLAGVSVFVL